MVQGWKFNSSEMRRKFLPMHTLPFFMNPSLQVHTKEPKVFAQVECSGQVPLISHSSTSALNKKQVGIYSEYGILSKHLSQTEAQKIRHLVAI